MVKKYKVMYNYSNYEVSFDTKGKKFQDFKAIHPRQKVIIINDIATHVVQIRYIKLIK